MLRPLPRLVPAALAVIGIFAVSPLRAQERAVLETCRIVEPTFEPSSVAAPKLDPARFPGGAERFQPVAAPCPTRTDAFGV